VASRVNLSEVCCQKTPGEICSSHSTFLPRFIMFYLQFLLTYLSIHSFIHPSTHLWLFVGPWPLFSFLIFTQSVGPLGRGISPSQGRYLHTQDSKTQNECTQTTMPRVGFEPSVPVFGRAKRVHALDREASVIGFIYSFFNYS
jgi:hypothetical protein